MDPLAYKKYWNQFSGSQGNQKEIATYDNLMKEYAMIKGIPIVYYTINVDDYKEGMDQIYGENSKPKWDRKYNLVAILEEFTPEAQEWGLRGLTNTDELTMFIHKSMFDELVGTRSAATPTKSKERRGAFGPVAKDQLLTPHNGLVYEILTGGVHFLPNEAQMFGKKFWYKVTCKVRETSDAVLGEGEQYGAIPDPTLDPQWKGNPQYLIANPTKEVWAGNTGTPVPSTSGTSGTDCNNPPEYTTTGTAQGPAPASTPNDLLDPVTGKVKEQYVGTGAKENSTFSDSKDIQKEADQIINPQTDQKVEPGTDDGNKYGPDGRVIEHTKRKELFGDW
jgi:hypothetical protein